MTDEPAPVETVTIHFGDTTEVMRAFAESLVRLVMRELRIRRTDEGNE